MTFALVQSKSGTATSGTTVSVTLTSATTQHNCLVVKAGAAQGSADPTVSGCTLGGSADNFAVGKAVNNNADADCEIWIDRDCAGGQTSVVVTFNAGTGGQQGNAVWVEEWSGVATASPVDKTSGANASGTSFSSGSTGTLANASELVLGAVAYFGSSSNTITGPASPWTNLAQVNAGTGGNGVALLASYQVVSATTALAYSGTDSTSNGYGAVIVTLKAAGPTLVSGSDTGSGTESSTITATLSDTETGAGADVGVISQPGTETGSGADTGTLTASVPGSETGTGAEASAIRVADTDTGAGADTGSFTLGASDADTGSGADTGSVTAATTTGADTGSGAETSSIAATLPAAADTGSGSDVATVGVSSSDTGSGAEVASQALYVPPPVVLWDAPDKLSIRGGVMK